MNKSYLVLTTDPNRRTIQVHFTDDVASLLVSIHSNPVGTGNRPHSDSILANRVVYQEYFTHTAPAIDRYTVLKQFTRMQLERLVRKSNPNWLNLYPQLNRGINIAGNRKAAGHAF